MEIQTELRTFQVEKICDKCKEGKMEYAGRGYSNGAGTFSDHKCTKCDNYETYKNKSYPHLIYKEIPRK